MTRVQLLLPRITTSKILDRSREHYLFASVLRCVREFTCSICHLPRGGRDDLHSEDPDVEDEDEDEREHYGACTSAASDAQQSSVHLDPHSLKVDALIHAYTSCRLLLFAFPASAQVTTICFRSNNIKYAAAPSEHTFQQATIFKSNLEGADRLLNGNGQYCLMRS